MTAGNAFIQTMKHPIKFRMFLFLKLPSAFFSGVRMRSLDAQVCTTSVPFKWFSQNPFRSTYFACLAMAAEMSTGLLAMLQVRSSTTAVSMLVVKLEGNYFKKAVERTLFTCTDGAAIKAAIEIAVRTGIPQTIRARSMGTNSKGEPVAEFFITWSFKSKAS
jgi:hypothetical protein